MISPLWTDNGGQWYLTETCSTSRFTAFQWIATKETGNRAAPPKTLWLTFTKVICAKHCCMHFISAKLLIEFIAFVCFFFLITYDVREKQGIGGIKEALKQGKDYVKRNWVSVSLCACCKSWRSDIWCSYVLRITCVWSDDDLLGKQPADSQTSARTQPGHYVSAKGSLMPGKFECKIPDICRSIPVPRRLRLTSQQKVKGLPLHPSLLKTVFSERGKAGSLKIYSYAHTISASGSRGRNWEYGTKLA